MGATVVCAVEKNLSVVALVAANWNVPGGSSNYVISIT